MTWENPWMQTKHPPKKPKHLKAGVYCTNRSWCTPRATKVGEAGSWGDAPQKLGVAPENGSKFADSEFGKFMIWGFIVRIFPGGCMFFFWWKHFFWGDETWYFGEISMIQVGVHHRRIRWQCLQPEGLPRCPGLMRWWIQVGSSNTKETRPISTLRDPIFIFQPKHLVKLAKRDPKHDRYSLQMVP